MSSAFEQFRQVQSPDIEKALQDLCDTWTHEKLYTRTAQTHPASFETLQLSEVEHSRIGNDLARYLFDPTRTFTLSGGKRIRPLLALMGAQIAGADPRQALSIGLSIELFQTAALIHDDIADHAHLRRGKPCLHHTHGEGLAINMGDFALIESTQVILNDNQLSSDVKLTVLKTLQAMKFHTLEGQALDLGWVHEGTWDLTDLSQLYMSNSKTAWYTTAMPLVMGALAGGGSQELIEVLGVFGMHIGEAFQLIDDYLNLTQPDNVPGKDTCSDLIEGKRTFIVIKALEVLKGQAREQLLDLLNQDERTNQDVQTMLNLLQSSGSLDICKQRAHHAISQAQQLVQDSAGTGIVSTNDAALLVSLTQYLFERTA